MCVERGSSKEEGYPHTAESFCGHPRPVSLDIDIQLLNLKRIDSQMPYDGTDLVYF